METKLIEEVPLLVLLRNRCEHPPRHYYKKMVEFKRTLVHEEVERALMASPRVIESLCKLEKTGGEVDVVKDDVDSYIITDCSSASPVGRRGLTFMQVEKMAKEFGVYINDEDLYRYLRTLCEVDVDSVSWGKPDTDTRERLNAALRFYNHGNGMDRGSAWHYYHENCGWRGFVRVPKVA